MINNKCTPAYLRSRHPDSLQHTHSTVLSAPAAPRTATVDLAAPPRRRAERTKRKVDLHANGQRREAVSSHDKDKSPYKLNPVETHDASTIKIGDRPIMENGFAFPLAPKQWISVGRITTAQDSVGQEIREQSGMA